MGMKAVILAARARAGTGEVLARVRATVARHAEVVGEFDVNDAIPAGLKPDRAVVVGGDGTIMAALRQFVDRAVPVVGVNVGRLGFCLLYTSPSPRDRQKSRMPSSA